MQGHAASSGLCGYVSTSRETESQRMKGVTIRPIWPISRWTVGTPQKTVPIQRLQDVVPFFPPCTPKTRGGSTVCRPKTRSGSAGCRLAVLIIALCLGVALGRELDTKGAPQNRFSFSEDASPHRQLRWTQEILPFGNGTPQAHRASGTQGEQISRGSEGSSRRTLFWRWRTGGAPVDQAEDGGSGSNGAGDGVSSDGSSLGAVDSSGVTAVAGVSMEKRALLNFKSGVSADPTGQSTTSSS